MTPLQLPRAIGGYEILRTLAAGGMGAVLLGEKATAQGFRKRVAIKVILPHLMGDAQARALFFDEAKLAARFTHPNLVQVFDFGEDAGFFHLVMEFVDGVSVQRLIGAAIAPDVAAHIVVDAARGLAWAHALRSDDGVALGVVHRDISPDNLVVTTSGGTKVLDFGIARSRDRSAASVAGLVRGKPPYMAPEHLRGEVVDGRADVWSLGVVFFELLTGRRLFVGDGLPVIRQVLEAPLAPALAALPAPAPLTDLVGRMLSRDAAVRPSMADVVVALERSGHVASSSTVARAVGAAAAHGDAAAHVGAAANVDVVPRGEHEATAKLAPVPAAAPPPHAAAPAAPPPTTPPGASFPAVVDAAADVRGPPRQRRAPAVAALASAAVVVAFVTFAWPTSTDTPSPPGSLPPPSPRVERGNKGERFLAPNTTTPSTTTQDTPSPPGSLPPSPLVETGNKGERFLPPTSTTSTTTSDTPSPPGSLPPSPLVERGNKGERFLSPNATTTPSPSPPVERGNKGERFLPPKPSTSTPTPSTPTPSTPTTTTPTTATAGIFVPDRRPWVDVYIDGARVGLSPLGSRRRPFLVAAGTHHVRLVDPATGAVVVERTLALAADEVVELR